MKKILCLMTAMSILLFAGGCANETPNSQISESDPFESKVTEGDPFYSKPAESSTGGLGRPAEADRVEALSVGGYDSIINDEKPIEYNGGEITIPVLLKASESCEVNISVGIGCNINGVVQKLSSGDEKNKTVLITTDIAPGETREFNITFTPVVSERDADKTLLPIQFVRIFNPDYVSTEKFTTFGNTHAVSMAPTTTLKLNAAPLTSYPKIEEKYTEEIINAEALQKYKLSGSGMSVGLFQNNDWASVLKINDNGGMDFSVVMSNYRAGTYWFSILKNNEFTVFNEGNEYSVIEVKDKHIYSADFHLDNVERGDVIQCICQEIAPGDYNEDDYYNCKTPGTALAVCSDFV